MLYPLKFKPRYKARIWGGAKLKSSLGKNIPADKAIGESWEISGVDGDLSVVSNGMLKGNNLQELIEVYMGDLVGEKIYDKFGLYFPVLIKLIDAEDVLSIQVHPDDKLAEERHNSYGKTEMWYIIDCAPDAEIYMGFNRDVTREEYLGHVADGTLPEILDRVKVKPGDAFFIPAGAIHAIGKGILIAEIQQTSDITYRVFDWNRVDANGKGRELHTELAVDAIDFSKGGHYDVTQRPKPNQAVTLKSCPYFTTNLVEIDGLIERDYARLDSFVTYTCLKGELEVVWEGGHDTLVAGESMLIPAELEHVTLKGQGKLLEVHM